ncbi:hypothetical protein GCM10008908_18600 [Clostridium subterminale]|uniref:Uncharacterized protein n=1 Tax=Clostridium subterminale TaxID=1550 RepID=A0ABN1KPM7_CLOSU
MNYNTQITTLLINKFREHFIKAGLREEYSKSIISHHDKSIRFTNSTTSVLKKYLSGSKIPGDGVFLFQPAMGLQGVDFWEENKQMEYFTSYFISMGTMGCVENLEKYAEEGVLFLADTLNIELDRIVIRADSEDEDIVNAVTRTNVTVELDACKKSDYRHVFGMENVRGRNANFAINNNGVLRDVGNLIIIERENKPIAIELSFDTTLLLFPMHHMYHPILALPSSKILYNDIVFNFTGVEYLVLSDFMTLSIVLILEGLKVKARGRGRNLRKIITLLSEIISELNISEEKIENAAYQIAEEELEIRKVLKSESKMADYITPEEVSKYLNFQLRSLKER